MPNQTYQNWKLETDKDQVLWVYCDKKDASVNTIDRQVMEEFAQIVDSIKEDTVLKGIIITSAKKKGFIAGADITVFTQFKDISAATSLLFQGQRILNNLEALKIPTVALIDGFCLGGGLELALACHYRVAEESNQTRLGLPEVKLGIHPGWGGTVRLPHLIGAMESLNLILNGHTVSGKTAAKLGFVDAAVPKRQLIHAAKDYILNKPPRHQASFLQTLSNKKFSRQIIAPFIRKKISAKVNLAHYPAPFQVVDNWEHAGVEGEGSFIREAKSCGRLFFSETCQNLVRVFFLQEKLKGLAKKTASPFKHVHVLGSGTMGGDIAAWCALQGLTVSLQDMEPHLVAPAIKRAYILYKEKLKENYLIQRAMDKLIPDVNGNGIAKADIVIEAVIEDLAIKQKVLQLIESKARHEAILATNTSSIPLDEINTSLENPERLIGVHFFNPVAKMMLVEVVRGEVTSQEIVDKTIQFVRQLDKLPLPVKSSPGFLVNRILMPYLLESFELWKTGVPMTIIDKAMTQFGMPMGPITLADTIGLDVCLSVAKHLGKYFQTPVPQQLIDLVAQKKMGKKTGEGFYKYNSRGKKIKPHETYQKPLTEISDRLVLRILNESFACLNEKIVAEDDLLDAGMIFGTGFAPFRGGPIHYAKTQGIQGLYQEYSQKKELSENKSSGLLREPHTKV